MNRLLACAAMVGAFGMASAQAHGESGGVKVGTLSCNERGGWGLILGSTHPVRCTFSNGERTERYDGSITRMGVDVGYQHSSTLVWAVVAPHERPAHGALAGHYGGATAGAAVGVGLGANALVGGSDRSIALQPISIEGKTGLNVAAGIGGMTLRARG